jgi:hypothetical protein
VLDRISFLGWNRLTSLMVLVNFLQSRIAPLQEHELPAWVYSGKDDTRRVEVGATGDLDLAAMSWML